MNIAIALTAFIVVALIVWAVAELNYGHFTYHEDEAHHDPTAHDNGGEELNIRDIMRDNSTRGFDAV